MRIARRVRSSVVRTVWMVLVLVVLAVAAAFVLNVVQALRPQAYKQCPDDSDRFLGRSQAYSDPMCALDSRLAALGSVYGSTPVTVRIDEDGDDLRTTVRMTLPKDDPLVGWVRSGEADDPFALVSSAFGARFDGSTSITWHPATVVVGDGASTADVAVSSTEPRTTAVRRRVLSDRPSTVDIALANDRLRSVSGVDQVSVQTDTRFTGTTAAHQEIVIALAPAGSRATDPGRGLWPALATAVVDFVWPNVLVAVPWLALVFFLRRRTMNWTRFRWLLLGLLGAHAVLIGTNALSAVDYSLPARTAANALGQRLRAPAEDERIGLALPPAGYFVISGTIVLLLCALTFLATRQARSQPSGGFALGWATGGFLLWVAAGLAWAWMLGISELTALVVALPLGAGALLILAGVGRLVGRVPFAPLAATALLAVPLAVIGALSDLTGALPAVLRVVVPFLAALGFLLAVARASTAVLTPDRRWRWIPLAISAALAFPVSVWSSSYDPPNWFVLQTFAFRVDAVLPVVLIVALAATLDRSGRPDTAGARSSVALWRLGLGSAFIVLAGVFSFNNRPSLTLLAAAGLSVWWLLPRSRLAPARRLDRLSSGEVRQAVSGMVRAGEARRALSPLRKNLREKVASGGLALAEASGTAAGLEREASARDRTVDGLTLQERAFGMLGGDSPSARARWGALTGTFAGLPWTALSLYGATTTLPADDPYPVLTTIAAIAPQLLRWTAYGALFGYFFPLLRGRSGLTKALALFVATLLPTVADVLPHGVGSHGWQTIALTAVQTLSFAMTLGLLADRHVLTSHGHDPARLLDIHNLGALAAWASSVAISAATALATALLVGLQPFILNPTQPTQPPATPPPATAQR